MYKNLKNLMKEKKITQEQLAVVIGTPRRETITAKVNGNNKSGFSFEEACKIKDAFFPEYDIRFVFLRDMEEEMQNA